MKSEVNVIGTTPGGAKIVQNPLVDALKATKPPRTLIFDYHPSRTESPGTILSIDKKTNTIHIKW